MSPLRNESYAIDVGAGNGNLTVGIQKTNPLTRVLAVDISEGMLQEIDKLNLPNIITQQQDAVTLSDLADHTFTHGFSSFTFPFVSDPHAAVRSLCRVVKPGGAIGIAMWGPVLDLTEIHNAACKRLRPDYTPARQDVPGSWREEAEHRYALESAGVEDVCVETIRMPFEAGDAKGCCDYWFRGGNPVPGKMVGDWVEQGWSAQELEREYERIVREEYGDGKRVFMDAVLGWGIKR